MLTFLVLLALHAYILTLIPKNNMWVAVFAPFLAPIPGIDVDLSAHGLPNMTTAFIASLVWTVVIFGIAHLIRRKKRTGMPILGDSFKLRSET